MTHIATPPHGPGSAMAELCATIAADAARCRLLAPLTARFLIALLDIIRSLDHLLTLWREGSLGAPQIATEPRPHRAQPSASEIPTAHPNLRAVRSPRFRLPAAPRGDAAGQPRPISSISPTDPRTSAAGREPRPSIEHNPECAEIPAQAFPKIFDAPPTVVQPRPIHYDIVTY